MPQGRVGEGASTVLYTVLKDMGDAAPIYVGIPRRLTQLISRPCDGHGGLDMYMYRGGVPLRDISTLWKEFMLHCNHSILCGGQYVDRMGAHTVSRS
jgi:hypothetical protein